jgi:hypothetical protein
MIIRECRSSGQTVSAWCSEHNINQKSYYYWLKRVRTAACEILPALSAGNNPIVEVNIPVSHPAGPDTSASIVVRYGSVTLEISNSASAALIENTLKALQNVR